MDDFFSEGDVVLTMPETVSVYSEVAIGEYTCLQLNEFDADIFSSAFRDNVFLGFSTVGVALILSLGAAVVIRMLKVQ